LPEVERVGSTFANIIGSRERKKRRVIRQSYLHAIRNAERYIYIANAYFLPGRGFRRALRNAVKRGVDVRVMVPARGDILPVQLASQALYGPLMRAGIRVFLWHQAVLHAKTAVIDDQWSTVGSFNIDHRSWAMNLEVNVNVVGPEFAGQLREVFESDQSACEELTPVVWRRRPILLRLLEGFCYLFRNWM
jgi:cardiolipin synthase